MIVMINRIQPCLWSGVPPICNRLHEINQKGNKLYDEYISERLQGDCNVDIFAPLKKVNAPIFKTSGNTKRINANGKIYELKDCICKMLNCFFKSLH